jgi:hypothetical protein
MGKRAILVLLAAFMAGALWAAPPASTSVTVEELDHLLVNLRGTSDKKAARELAGLKLTERLGLGQLTRWQADLPGARSRDALLALADASAFLRPPASEIPNVPAPDAATQDQILAHTFDYVQRTLPKLPNFLAKRTITGFDVTTEDHLNGMQLMAGPLQARPNKQFTYLALGPANASGLPSGQLYWTGSIAEAVSYRDGKEELEPLEESGGSPGKNPLALTTEGEFGPILTVILNEAPRDKIVWDRWEHRGENGTAANLAVFHFFVPRDRSHYEVAFTADQIPDFPEYQGEITVDPNDGTVYRITIDAKVRDSSTVDEASIMVEYGPAEIGDITYTLPIHGVGMAKSFDSFADLDAQPPPIPFQTAINDIAFTGYHVFRAKSRIVPGAGGP